MLWGFPFIVFFTCRLSFTFTLWNYTLTIFLGHDDLEQILKMKTYFQSPFGFPFYPNDGMVGCSIARKNYVLKSPIYRDCCPHNWWKPTTSATTINTNIFKTWFTIRTSQTEKCCVTSSFTKSSQMWSLKDGISSNIPERFSLYNVIKATGCIKPPWIFDLSLFRRERVFYAS